MRRWLASLFSPARTDGCHVDERVIHALAIGYRSAEDIVFRTELSAETVDGALCHAVRRGWVIDLDGEFWLRPRDDVFDELVAKNVELRRELRLLRGQNPSLMAVATAVGVAAPDGVAP